MNALVEQVFPAEALVLDQPTFNAYDAKYLIRERMLTSNEEKAALTRVRRTLMGRERSRNHRQQEKTRRLARKARWKKAKVVVRLLAIMKAMKQPQHL
jgi:hypothetical protein